jgi:hypothetical protein
MKIAYLILAYNNFIHLQRLIDALTTDSSSFYIHIDKRVKAPEIKGRNITFIKRRNSYWSTFNCVSPTIEMLKLAIKDDNDYCLLISGQDYPIVSNERIELELSNGKQRIWLREGIGKNPISYYRYYHFLMERRNATFKYRLVKKLELLSRFILQKTIPFKIYTGSTWFGVTKECAHYILKTIDKDKRYINFFKHSRFPEESFFCTIIGNSPFVNNITCDPSFTHWKKNHIGPVIITKELTPIIKKTPYLFARKFRDDSLDVINVTEKELRGIDQFRGEAITTNLI